MARRVATRPKRSSAVPPNSRRDGHRRDEHAEADRADRLTRAVAVDHRDGHPVVGRPLGEREAQHHEAHEQRPRLAPGGQHDRSGASRPPPARRGRAQEHRVATAIDTGARTATTKTCAESGTPAAAAAAPIPAPGDRAQAEAGVQPRHERAAEAALDVRALDVHRDVPDPDAQPDEHQAGDGERHRHRAAARRRGRRGRPRRSASRRARRPARRGGARSARTAAARRSTRPSTQSSSRPSCADDSPRVSRTAGVREIHEAKHRPLTRKATATAVRACRIRRRHLQVGHDTHLTIESIRRPRYARLPRRLNPIPSTRAHTASRPAGRRPPWPPSPPGRGCRRRRRRSRSPPARGSLPRRGTGSSPRPPSSATPVRTRSPRRCAAAGPG